MSYLSRMLLPDERIIYIATIHWIVLVPGIILTVIGGLIGYYSYDLVGLFMGRGLAAVIGRAVAGAGLIVSLFGFSFLLSALVKQSSTELAITNRRIIAKYGFISRATFEILINRVTGVNFDQTVMGRIMGYGTILVHGAGGDISPFDVVTTPQLFQRALMDVLEHVNNPSR